MSPDPYTFTQDDRQLLAGVGHWPLVMRRVWANRVLEIASRRHCALELAEVTAARELLPRAREAYLALQKGKSK